MENIKTLLYRLATNFSILKGTIKAQNRANDFSLNILAEPKILNIYNIITDFELVNANALARNTPGIDGYDEKNLIIAQVTSTFSSNKISHTINQVFAQKYHDKYKRLIILFLSDKKKLSEAVRKSIQAKVATKFKFDPSTDLIDLNDIYSLYALSSNQDLKKIHEAVKILDELLRYVPLEKDSGLDAISICFHDEEIENVYSVVHIILKEGINVYTTSKRLYQKFEGQRFSEFLILVQEGTSIDHIQFCITVYSNSFVQGIIVKNELVCKLFANAVENDCKNEIISFDTHLKDVNKIRNKDLLNFQIVNTSNLQKKVEKILKKRQVQSEFANVGSKEVKDELIYVHNNLQKTSTIEEANFSLLHMEDPKKQNFQLNYLILPSSFNLTEAVQSFSALRTNYSYNLTVLVPKDFSHKTTKRLDAVAKAFDVLQVEYIDEYLFDSRFSKLVQKPILTIDKAEFIAPVILLNDEQLEITDILHWIFNNSDSSIAIISGPGGIGKTTLCEKLHDLILEESQRSIVIYINAEQYIKILKENTFDGNVEYDLYNIFRACHPHGRIIDQNSFYINYAFGNIVVIFDGIDEIISTIPHFSLEVFLSSLEDLRLSIGRGKILINCRDIYVTNLKAFYKDVSKLQIYDLQAFNEALARQFFSIHLPDKSKVNDAIKIVKELFVSNQGLEAVDVDFGYKYPPFVLQIVNVFVSDKFEYSVINSDFSSLILLEDNIDDTIVHKICVREYFKRERFGFQLQVDSQVRFLCELAIEYDGRINDQLFGVLLRNIDEADRIDEVSNGLKDHPLLNKFKGTFGFRFDFFNNYFKSVSIFTILSKASKMRLTEHMIENIAFNCGYNSLICNLVVKKANNSQQLFSDCLSHLKLVIASIMAIRNAADGWIRKRNKCISNLVLILLLSVRNSKYSSTYILKYLFERDGDNEKNTICNFYFFDIPAESRIEFDFSDLILVDCEIDNFDGFFSCKFNNNTYFYDTCGISRVYNQEINFKNISATTKNFDGKIKSEDNSLFRVLTIKNSGNNVNLYLKDYLNYFYSQNEFRNGVMMSSINIRKDDVVNVKMLTDILIKFEIISSVEEKRVFLNEHLKSKIIRFLKEGLAFKELNQTIRYLNNLFHGLPFNE